MYICFLGLFVGVGDGDLEGFFFVWDEGKGGEGFSLKGVVFDVGGLERGGGLNGERGVWDCFVFEYEGSVFGFSNLWMLGVELFSFYGDGELMSGFWGRKGWFRLMVFWE